MTLPGARPRPGWLLGIDTSAAQGVLDVEAIQAAGVAFGIFKATHGRSKVDEQWGGSVASATFAGFPFGAYGVLVPGEPAEEQARHFARQVSDSGAFLYALDFELAFGETGLAALESAAAWCRVAEEELGHTSKVYAGDSFMRELERLAGEAATEALSELSGRGLWVAHYGVERPRVPPPWSDWFLWQASGNGAARLPSSRVEVDVDWFRGTLDQLLAAAR